MNTNHTRDREIYCKICGRLLLHRWGVITCPKHKQNWDKPQQKREKIGRYSGQSKSEFAFNDYK